MSLNTKPQSQAPIRTAAAAAPSLTAPAASRLAAPSLTTSSAPSRSAPPLSPPSGQIQRPVSNQQPGQQSQQSQQQKPVASQQPQQKPPAAAQPPRMQATQQQLAPQQQQQQAPAQTQQQQLLQQQQQGRAPIIVDNLHYRGCALKTYDAAVNLAILKDKAIKMDYWVPSLDKKCFFGIANNNSKDKLLMMTSNEYTSKIEKARPVAGTQEIVVETENSIYIVSRDIEVKQIDLPKLYQYNEDGYDDEDA